MDLRKKVHFINFCRKMALNAVFFLSPLYFLKNGFSGWQIGTAVSLYALTPLLVTFPTGWVNDRLAITQVVRGALVTNGLIFLVLSQTKDFLLTAFCFALFGAANSVLDVSLNSLYYKDEREANLNRKFGMLSFWLNLGTSAGTLLGGLLIFLSGFRVMFYALAGLMVVTFLAVRRFGQERFEMVSLREYRLAFFTPKALLLSLMLFILTLHWGVEGTVYSPFLRQTFGLNSLQLAVYISAALLVMALASFRVSRLRFDPEANRKIFLVGMLLSGGGLMLMVVPNVYLSFMARVVHEAGDGLMAALVTIFISRLFARRNIGGNAGLLQAIFTLGHMAGAEIFAPLGYGLGLRIPFLIAGALLILDCGFAFLLFRKLPY
jgi:MFS family permease